MDEYVSKVALKISLDLIFNYYENAGIEEVECDVIKNDIYYAIDNMDCVHLEDTIRKIEKLLTEGVEK